MANAISNWDRVSAQLSDDKLDTNAVTLKEAKQRAEGE